MKKEGYLRVGFFQKSTNGPFLGDGEAAGGSHNHNQGAKMPNFRWFVALGGPQLHKIPREGRKPKFAMGQGNISDGPKSGPAECPAEGRSNIVKRTVEGFKNFKANETRE